MAFTLQALLGLVASAQDRTSRPVFFPIQSDHDVLWRQIEKSRERGDATALLEGLTRITELVLKPETNSVVEAGEELAIGLRHSFRELVASLSPAELERFEPRVNPLVSDLWAKSQSQGDRDAHRRLRHLLLRDFPFADVHGACLKEEIDFALEAGDWNDVGRLATEIARLAALQPNAEDSLNDEVRARLIAAQAALVLGSPARESAREELGRLVKAARFEGVAGDLKAQVERLLAEPLPAAVAPARAAADESRGSFAAPVVATSAADAGASFRLGGILWEEQVPAARLRAFVDERSRRSSIGDAPTPYHPAARDGVLVFEQEELLLAYDLARGQVRWRSTPSPGRSSFATPRMPLITAAAVYRTDGAMVTAHDLQDGQVLWRRQVIHDRTSQSLQWVDPEVETPPPEDPEPETPPEAEAAAPPDEAVKDKRKKSNVTGSAPRTLLEISAPAPLGHLIALAVTVRIGQETQSHLVSLRADGDVEWSTFLGSMQGGNYLGLGNSGSSPVASGASVFLLTSGGTIASVDRRDGAIQWLRAYAPLSVRAKRDSARIENRWHPNPLILLGNQLIAATQDSAFLLSLDSRNGEVLWRAPREANSTLVGATDRACFVVGKGAMAISHTGPDRGRTLWRVDGDNPRLLASGRALLTPGALLIPTREALVTLALTDGAILDRTFWEARGGGGNLLLFDLPEDGNQVLAMAGASGLYIYGDYRRNRAHVDALPRDSTEALLAGARLHLRSGEIAPALTLLDTWKASAPPNPQPNSPLDHLHLDLAELIRELLSQPEEEPQALKLLRFRVLLERIPGRKIDACLALAKKLEATKAWSEAADTLHEALQFNNPATLHSPDGRLSIASADILRERILELRQRQGVEAATVFARVEAMARDALRRAQNKLKTPIGFREVTRLYPFTPAAAEAYFDLARLYLDAQAHDQAALALDGYVQDFPAGRDVVRARLLAANLVRQSGRNREARERYSEILLQHANSVVEGVEGARPGESVEAYVRTLLADPGLAAAEAMDSPELKFPVRMAWRSPADLASPKRTMIRAQGSLPDDMQRTFLTQSEDVIELRDNETGLPIWKTHLELIPGFELDDPGLGRNFRLPRTGRRSFQARFLPLAPDPGQGFLLVLNDERNLLAVDPRRGLVRWHIPIGPEKEARDGTEPFRLHLREKLRGVTATAQGVYALTTRGRLLRVSLKGEIDWEARINFPTWPFAPITTGDGVYVIGQPFRVVGLDPANGQETPDEKLAAALESLGSETWRPALEVDGKLLLTSGEQMRLLHLGDRRVAWEYRKGGRIEEVFHFPEAPDEYVVSFRSRANGWPSLACLSLSSGLEQWRFEKFRPTSASSVQLLRDGNRFYVLLAGQESGSRILGLQIREGLAGESQVAESLWPGEQLIGSTFGYLPGRLQVSDDSLFFLESSSSLRVFDKWNGAPRHAPASVIERFLLEKEDSTCTVLSGKLVILTDGGDCAFEALTSSPARREAGPMGPATSSPLARLQKYFDHPGDVDNTSQLALHYFRAGETLAAIDILNRALLSEDILEERGAEKRFVLSYLLDGFKEEYMKSEVPGISSRRFTVPPAIDGDLSDPWDVSSRVALSSPRHIGTIPGPDQRRDWEGEEDLSAVLYTGWDDKYFYFALDVSDDVLHPFDRDSENWKGDCLVIGLDPTNDQGYRQHGDDQLMTLALTVPRRNKLNKKQDGEAEEEEEEDEEEERRRPKGLFQVKKKEDDSGAIYEVALPWHEYFTANLSDEPPTAGYTFGLSLLVTDDDKGQGATKTLSLNSCHLLPKNQRSIPAWRFIVPYFFPKVTLD